MSRKSFALLALAALPALLMAWPQPGDPAPYFALSDTANVQHRLPEFRGKVIQLFFWQST